MARTLKRLAFMPLVTLGLFGIGRTPTERAVRHAYRWLFDRDEAAGSRMSIESAQGTAAFTKRVYAGASSMRREVPEAVDTWNDLATTIAVDEAHEPDLVTGTPMGRTSREVRERAVADLTAALVDPPSAEGHYEGLLSAMGVNEETLGAIEEFGELPSIAEMRNAIDRCTFEDLVAARDAMRAELPAWLPQAFSPSSPMLAFMLHRFDDPRVGVELACGLAAGLAVEDRAARAEMDQAVDPRQSAG